MVFRQLHALLRLYVVWQERTRRPSTTGVPPSVMPLRTCCLRLRKAHDMSPTFPALTRARICGGTGMFFPFRMMRLVGVMESPCGTTPHHPHNKARRRRVGGCGGKGDRKAARRAVPVRRRRSLTGIDSRARPNGGPQGRARCDAGSYGHRQQSYLRRPWVFLFSFWPFVGLRLRPGVRAWSPARRGAGGRGLPAPGPLQPPTPPWARHPWRGSCPFRRTLSPSPTRAIWPSPFRCPARGTSVRAASELPRPRRGDLLRAMTR